ncbi:MULTISPECIES: methyl-accepting chemotaxis protein [unclassified Massilia]|uniref:methyl-accepting chemotaxis protein n=1 Tax=unclassified Massilia TaxID=2609279 RepID=UPI001B82BD92|nr:MULTISPECIES: methyl-accepting chemotaxis protein [unclassified Massilia]MBQ5938454.1 Cache 3/Cache 2 fusion domain-containing protein [Massilia sp. AB1]MBQ5963238.1 Cache 3/Cache 2 fusion domain-containing protein [Massilia sp. ZL223]
MKNSKYHPANWSVGTRISAINFTLVSVIIAVLVGAITVSTSRMLEERAAQSVANELKGVTSTVELFNKTVSGQAVGLGHIFRASLPGSLELDTESTGTIDGKTVPRLKLDGNPLNLDFSAPDSFTEQTGGNATIFVLDGEDFVRVSTSVKKENGARAVGTSLDRASPAYAALREGKTYIGMVSLFGKPTITQYEPARDASGKIVGALYVGVDISKDMALLKERIRSIKIGDTGYFYVLNAAPGKQYGELVVHPAKEGQNILDSRAADGRPFIKQILESKNGTINYDWQNPGETSPREKFVAYAHVKDWNWVIAGGTYRDEIVAAASDLRKRFILLGLVSLAILSGVLHYVIRRSVSRPLAQAREVARRIAEGDLTAQATVKHRDEIGALTQAMNAIGGRLSSVVGQVREGAEQIANASQEISAGNLDLCQRTEEQAASLATTASSMDDLTGTVRQNAEHANQANELARKASSIAQKGGDTVAQVVERMESITQASRKISDITGVIDGIAFQTNILALNAAVEAARAGEQGRGFAVVANEVRGLAQRCAAAAKEIKGLIEASNGEVDAGSRLVAEAGQTMQEVLASVGRVTDIMADISAAGHEQTRGIEDVNRAIGEMDAVTQQNAALVEEASAAATAMHEQADALARSVRQFRLADDGETGKPALAPTRRPALAR